MPLVKRASPPAEASGEAQATVEALLADLQSPYPQARRAAARQLAEHPETASALCAAVVAEAQESVRVAIFTALIRIGTKAAAEGLLPMLSSEDVGLRNGAIEALKTMPDAVAERVDEIFAGSADVRIFGVEVIGAIGHPEAARWLMHVIDEDTDINVCAAAVEALGECGDENARAALLRLLDRFPDEPFLEFSVRTTLARIANG